MRRSWGTLALALVSGCGEGEPEPGTAPEVWCRGLCSASLRCGQTHSRHLCETDCVGDRPGLTSFSLNGAQALEPCLAGLSCSALSSEVEWDAELDACWAEAQERVEVTQDARALCVDYAAAWFECGAWWTVEDCERSYSMWIGAVARDTRACISAVTCDELQACNDRVFEAL